ncbi:PflA homolog [Mobilicoccus pelagius NBRC 104925]|uniref:PflA homolog n=1 Tax=Mobilicoccus pelagius NBRC 104925 TaxID=1089455 RepID=H5UV27_9MICO|nr:PflA homolog [Mobilicoccus pelagius NBRC 104925]
MWVELTTLLIPGANDSDAELEAMCRWGVANLGPDVPHHFSAFHPDHRMTEVERTPLATLLRARDIAHAAGERYVYTGNVVHRDGEATACPVCGLDLVERGRYRVLSYRLAVDPTAESHRRGRCPRCGHVVPGVFEPEAGSFGARHLPISVDG